MAANFAYAVATNKITVCNGTSGTPMTFAGMYTADQAGTGTVLLAATAGSATNTLTYPIRPTAAKALVVKCIVASKTTEADYIFITGTDAWGTAQTESFDVSAGNGTYTTTKRFATISNLDCSDNAAGGGTVWADGTIAVTQDIWGVVWEIVAGKQYKIDCDVDIGDDSTATYFQTENEAITFTPPKVIVVYNNATFQIGVLYGDWGIKGSFLDLAPSATYSPVPVGKSTASLLFYSGKILLRTNYNVVVRDGTVDWRNFVYEGMYEGINSASRLVFKAEVDNLDINKTSVPHL